MDRLVQRTLKKTLRFTINILPHQLQTFILLIYIRNHMSDTELKPPFPLSPKASTFLKLVYMVTT